MYTTNSVEQQQQLCLLHYKPVSVQNDVCEIQEMLLDPASLHAILRGLAVKTVLYSAVRNLKMYTITFLALHKLIVFCRLNTSLTNCNHYSAVHNSIV